MYWLKNNWFIIVAAVLIIVFFFFDDSGTKSPPPAETEQISENKTNSIPPSEAQEVTPAYILIDIKGEVVNPGIYQMDNGSRVNELIEQAGGLTRNADTNQINLAQKLADEMVIIVPALGDTPISTSIPSLTASGTGDVKVNINTARLEELMNLDGIGASKAEAILAYREENGPFSTPEDLLKVTGIGEKTLENMRENILVP